MEEWRDVPGFNGKYQIDISTKAGRCRSINFNRTGRVKELTNNINKDGRLYWHLSFKGKAYNQQAAVWIAITYPELVENEYFEGAEIDHIDTDTLNNHPSNLRWVDRTGQMNNPLTKQHLSESQKGEKNPRYGKHLPEETRKKISQSLQGKKVSDETRKKMSVKRKGFRHTEDSKKKMSLSQLNHPSRSISISQYDLKGNFMMTYPSAREAARQNPDLNLVPVCISLCCKGKRKTHKGFIWKYAG